MSEQGPTPSVEEINGRYPEHIRRYAAGQYLSNLAYYLAEQKIVAPKVPVMNIQGKFENYLVKPFKLKKGLFAYLLLPEDKSSNDVKVIFRGTDVNDPRSRAINLELWGPGYMSFQEEKDNIFNSIDAALVEHYGEKLPDLKLDVSGHSQGAALSQLFVAEFLERRGKSGQYDAFKMLTLNAFNSPGVPHSVAKAANNDVITQHISKNPIIVKANYGMVGGDAVQVTGNDMIFVALEPRYVELNLLKVDVGLEGQWTKGFHFADGIQLGELISLFTNTVKALTGAHPTTNFYAPLDSDGKITVKSKYEYFTNKKAEDIPKITGELLNKALYLQYFLQIFKIPTMYFLNRYHDYQDSNAKSFRPLSASVLSQATAQNSETESVDAGNKSQMKI